MAVGSDGVRAKTSRPWEGMADTTAIEKDPRNRLGQGRQRSYGDDTQRGSWLCSQALAGPDLDVYGFVCVASASDGLAAALRRTGNEPRIGLELPIFSKQHQGFATACMPSCLCLAAIPIITNHLKKRAPCSLPLPSNPSRAVKPDARDGRRRRAGSRGPGGAPETAHPCTSSDTSGPINLPQPPFSAAQGRRICRCCDLVESRGGGVVEGGNGWMASACCCCCNLLVEGRRPSP